MVHFEEIVRIKDTKLRAFTEHVLVSGKSGSGKGNLSEFLLTQLIGKRKAIDCFDSSRFESCLYSLPEKNQFLASKIRTLSGGQLEPRGFPNDVFLISGKRLAYLTKFPNNVKIVSLNEEDLKLDDLFFLLGKSESSQAVLGYLQHTHGDMGITELMKLLEAMTTQKGKQVSTQSIYFLLRQIRALLNSGMFDKRFPALQLREIIKDKDTITSFNSWLLENDFEIATFLGILLKKILDCKKAGIKTPITMYLREISYILGQYANKEMKLAQKMLLSCLREGRDLGINLICDTQRVTDLTPTFRRQFGVHCMLRTDKRDAEMLNQVTEVPPYVIEKIAKLDVGQGIICDNANYFYPIFFVPCLHAHKKVGQDVFATLIKHFGSYEIEPPPQPEPETIPIVIDDTDDAENKISNQKNREGVSEKDEFADIFA